MAITTYAELKTAIQSWASPGGGASITSLLGDFVTLAESNIRRDVRVRSMVQTATGTLSSATLALPTRFLEALVVTLADVECQYLNPQQFDELSETTHYYYTIRGTNFEFGQTTGDYSITYYQAFAAFSGASDTNALLTEAPEVYLFAGLAEAAVYMRQDPAIWLQRYQAAVAKLQRSERQANTAPTVRVHPCYVV